MIGCNRTHFNFQLEKIVLIPGLMTNLHEEVPYYTLLRQRHQWGKTDFF